MKGGPSGEQCRHCYFAVKWEDEDVQEDPYLCHRYPPTETIEGEDGNMPITVRPTTWCGEFKRRAEATL